MSLYSLSRGSLYWLTPRSPSALWRGLWGVLSSATTVTGSGARRCWSLCPTARTSTRRSPKSGNWSPSSRADPVRELRLGVDVGGTFTDLVALGDGRISTAKVPSTPTDQSEGVMHAIAASQVEAGAFVALAHGMTVATNALLERRGARTALITTSGFKDVLEIARQDRPALYDLAQDRPPALVPRGLRFSVE